MSKVLIIGGGAAGMMAAVAAGENGHEVWLYEKNDRLGRKLFITGKGRCNITNAGDMETLFASVMSNPKFLYSSFYTFTNDQVIDFFEELGVRTKIERGNRVFPLSDHSSDVIAGLKRKMETLGVRICLETEVEKIEGKDGKFQAIVLKGGQRKTEMPVLLQPEESLTRRPDLPATDTGSQKKTDIRLQNFIRLWFRWKSGNGMQRNCRGSLFAM